MTAQGPVRPALYAALVLASAGAALLGFAREAAVAAFFGASRQADAFYAALSIPFVAAQFLVGGALAPPLTATLAELLERGERVAARGLLARAAAGIVATSLLLTVATALALEPLTRLLVPGFSAAERALTGTLLLALWIYGGATALSLAGSAALTATGAYRTPAGALLAGNAVSLAVLLALRGEGIVAAAWALDAGALVQLTVVTGRLARAGLLGRPSRGTPASFPAHHALWLGASLVAAGSVDLLERPFASAAGAGAVALLSYASKLIHLPMRLVAAPLASVAFPRLVRGRAREDRRASREAGETGDRVLALLAWCAATTAAAAAPIAALTFGRGRFGADAVERLALLLRFLAPAVIAVGLVELLSKYLLAHGRARTVAAAQGAALLVYLVAAPLLSRHGAPGLAGARALSWVTAAAALALPLVARSREMRLFSRGPTLLLSALAAGTVAAFLLPLVPGPRLAKVVAAAATTAAVVVAALLLRERLGPTADPPEPAP